jgi:predicted nucleic acid binding AN1-type Zn finger protein
MRLQAKTWAHFLMHIPPTEKKKNVTIRCAVCYSRGKRSESAWQCKKCGVALHLEDCFI